MIYSLDEPAACLNIAPAAAYRTKTIGGGCRGRGGVDFLSTTATAAASGSDLVLNKLSCVSVSV